MGPGWDEPRHQPLPLLRAVPCTGARELGPVAALGVTNRVWAWGVQSQPTLRTQTQTGAGRGPLDNCSSQPSLISGILAGSQLSAMQSRGSGAGIKACGSAAQCHHAGGWQGSLCPGVGGEGPPGSPCPFSCLPSPRAAPPLLSFHFSCY